MSIANSQHNLRLSGLLCPGWKNDEVQPSGSTGRAFGGGMYQLFLVLAAFLQPTN